MQRWSSSVFVYSVCKSPCLVQPIGTRGWHSICVQPIASQNHSHVISKKFLGVVQGVLAPSWPPFWLIVIFYHNYIPHPMCNCFNENKHFESSQKLLKKMCRSASLQLNIVKLCLSFHSLKISLSFWFNCLHISKWPIPWFIIDNPVSQVLYA